MNPFLKYAGIFGVGLGMLFGVSGIVIAATGWDPEPIAPFVVSIIIGSVIAFGGCLILVLNDIALQLRKTRA